MRLQTARPDFNIVHYATDTGIWSEYFSPGLHQAFGGLWPLVLLAAVGSAAVAIGWGRSRAIRWAGAVALFGMLAYLFTPLGAAGPEGDPTGFEINIRFVVPALLLALALLPLPGSSTTAGASGACLRRWSSSSSSAIAPTPCSGTPTASSRLPSPSSSSASRRLSSRCAGEAPRRWR